MKNIKAIILVFAAMLFSLPVMANDAVSDFPIVTSFNIGTGVVKSSAVDQDIQATVSVGFETIGEFTWVAADISAASAGKADQTSYSLDTKVGLIYGKLRPYTSLGYSRTSLSDLGSVDFSKESVYGAGVRYDLTKTIFLDVAYKTLDGKSEVFTTKVHYKFN